MAQIPTVEYETTIFTLKPDNIGPNKATLLHARTTNTNCHLYKAILYLHGYIDYYFHDHICIRFLEHDYDFYALDMRKCGRSIISPEHDEYKHYCNDLNEYDEEITLAIEYIINEAKNKTRRILLFGHSTGGLIAIRYACSGTKHTDIDGIILNSPYLATIESTLIESILMRILIKFLKFQDVDGGWYGRSLHISNRGEWNFDLNKKPIDKIRLHGSFFLAVHRVQQDLKKKRITIQCPVLLMCSNRSMRANKQWRNEYAEVDLILNVKAMRRVASMMGSQVTIHEIENAKHDIFLSKESVREKAFDLMFQWIQHLEEDWITITKL
ncbi:unnamed protein product [Rotaria sordida]|uniref:Serine aminopeptidase S33 domain-containing protein n=1 Tax=Rotaria sordida TaxID=392033 RepID=A0A814J4Q2_9BILA|nr:unnamed protein product [Rotaria sordida]CAF1060402.1 unnamed protein product [Rotaria sordida]CAF3919314.1 unnamed protein product [Rotaria sordida]